MTRSSGKSHHVKRRYACNKYLRQTFHEFADHVRRWSSWSKVYYQHLRDKGKSHNAAVRALAYKWIRIIYRVWKTREPYDEARYFNQPHPRPSPLAKLLETH